MEKNIEIKHLHGSTGLFNGRIVFLVKNRLMTVRYCTPNFNDYGEYRISEFSYSKHEYKPEDNQIELEPYKGFKSIFISDEDFKLLELISKFGDEDFNSDGFDYYVDNENNFMDELRGGMMEGEKTMTIFNDKDRFNPIEVKYDKWLELDDDKKTPFENIFYPILIGFKEGWLNRRLK